MQVLGHWDLGFNLCLAWTGSDVTLSTASIMHLCAIALHRYHGIAHPLRMRSASESRRVAALVAPAWSIAVALSVPLVVQGVFDRSHVLAPLDPVVNGGGADDRLSCGIFNRTFAIYSSLVSFFIPLAVMIVADFRSVQILRKNIQFPVMATIQSSAARRLRAMRQISDRSGHGDTDDDDDGRSAEIPCSVHHIASSDATSTISVTSPEVGVTQTAIPDDVQHRPEVDSSANSAIASVGGEGHGHPATTSVQTPSSEASFVYRGRSRSKSMVYLEMLASCGRSFKVNSRERRAEKTLIWVFAAFVALWLPFFCANLAYGVCGGVDGLCNVPPRLFAAFTWLGYMSSGVNPCIYTLLNRDFRAAFRHLLMCQPSRLRAANSFTMATTLRANSVRFTHTSSVNGTRPRAGTVAAADNDHEHITGLDMTNVVVTPSFP